MLFPDPPTMYDWDGLPVDVAIERPDYKQDRPKQFCQHCRSWSYDDEYGACGICGHKREGDTRGSA